MVLGSTFLFSILLCALDFATISFHDFVIFKQFFLHSMEEQHGHETPMQLMSFAFGGNANDMSHLCQDNPNHQYVMTAGRNQVPSVPLSLSHWLQCQQTSQGYVEYLAERDIAEIQRDTSYNNPRVAFGFQPADSFVGMEVRKVESYFQIFLLVIRFVKLS